MVDVSKGYKTRMLVNQVFRLGQADGNYPIGFLIKYILVSILGRDI